MCIMSAREENRNGETGETEKRERERQVGAGSIASRSMEEDRRRAGLCGGETKGEEEGGLKEAHCLPSEADNSVMNVSNARPRSGL